MIARRPLLAAAGALALRPRFACAGRALTLLVPAAAGSPPDQSARAFAPFLERHLPHSVVWVSNRPGDAGLAGLRALADAEPTGQTVGWVSTPALSARCVDHAGAEGLLNALRLLGAAALEPIAFVSPPEAALASVQDLLRRSDGNAAGVPLGTPPPGSPPHLAALKLQAVARTTLNVVAFPSGVAACEAALAGNVAAAVLGLGDALAGLRSGRLTALGLAASERDEAFPDFTTVGESGVALSVVIRRGLAVPAATPADICDRIAAALQGVVADPEFRAQAETDGFVGVWNDGAHWTAQARDERREFEALWRELPWFASGIG